MTRLRHPLVQVGIATLLTLPWFGTAAYNFAAGMPQYAIEPIHYSTGITVLLTGLAVLGSSFLLAWGAETAEKDVPRAFAIAVLALLAVAPEYAVDALYAWNAGAGGATAEACAGFTEQAIANADPGTVARACHDGNLAIANMTGANRILIGLGWSGIALFTVYRAVKTRDPAVRDRPGFLTDAVQLDPDIATEVMFLFLATIWAFLVPLGGGIDIVDTVFLVGLYVAYIILVMKSDIEAEEAHVGVPNYLQQWSRPRRVATVLTLFLYPGAMIFLSVEEFAHGLETLGIQAGIPSFFMIQWIAPLASESPELIVVAVLVNKARSTAGFNALISSKLNQWTLLIGTLAVVYSLAAGQYGMLPFDAKQGAEIWITAAQSFFALAILVNLEISMREAIALLVLFVSQVVIEFSLIKVFPAFEGLSYELLIGYTVLYMVLGTALFIKRRKALRRLMRLAGDAVRTAMGREPVTPEYAD